MYNLRNVFELSENEIQKNLEYGYDLLCSIARLLRVKWPGYGKRKVDIATNKEKSRHWKSVRNFLKFIIHYENCLELHLAQSKNYPYFSILYDAYVQSDAELEIMIKIRKIRGLR